MPTLPLLAATCGFLLIGTWGPTDDPVRAAAGPVEHFTATAVTASRAGLPPAAVSVEIVIDRWSTDAERGRVIESAKNESSKSLLALIRGLPSIGYISTPTSRGTSLHFAESRPIEGGGRRIIAVTDRPLAADTARTRTRRGDDYPFSIVDIRIDSSGSGEGTLHYSARLSHDAKTGALETKDYASEPVRLTTIRSASASAR